MGERQQAEARRAARQRHELGRVAELALDLSDGYRSFARRFFPNAQLVADKFHVLRLARTEGFNGKAKLVIRRAYG